MVRSDRIEYDGEFSKGPVLSLVGGFPLEREFQKSIVGRLD